MKLKKTFQILTLLTLVFSVFGINQKAQAKANFSVSADAAIVLRDTTYWNATYTGNVDASRYEKWSFQLSETNTFTITASVASDGLAPVISLLDLNGNEISTLTGVLNTTQPTGNYYILIKPQSGSSVSYNLTIRKTNEPIEGLSASVSFDPASIMVEHSSLVTVSLNNVPATGLTSAEFTCTYDPAFIDVSGITDLGLFGLDSVMVINDAANGIFIVALAGSNGNRAITSGGVFIFYATGLQVGQTSITCAVRVSKGDKTLTEVASTAAALTITTLQGALAGQVTASKPVTISVRDTNNTEVASVISGNGVFNLALPVGTYTVIASADGFLPAQDSATITSGTTNTKPNTSLLAGDIDGNDVIDQFDAMTIGMSYNTAAPTAADLNNDGTINVLDLELLAANYRKSGALAW